MDNPENQMSQDEFQTMKDRLRKDAYEKELIRLLNIDEKRQKTIRILVVFLVLITLANLIAWIIYFDPFLNFRPKKVELPMAINTQLQEPKGETMLPDSATMPLDVFFTVQVGAFRKKAKPDFLNRPDFPIIHYENKSLNCYAFGKFTTLEEAQQAICFLVDLGFTNCIVKKIENGIPTETFD